VSHLCQTGLTLVSHWCHTLTLTSWRATPTCLCFSTIPGEGTVSWPAMLSTQLIKAGHVVSCRAERCMLCCFSCCAVPGPLVMHVAKLFPKNDCSSFDAYGRIISGTLRPGDEVSPSPGQP
jgi:hypothetical protein